MERYEMADGRAALLLHIYETAPYEVLVVERDGETVCKYFTGTYAQCRNFIEDEKKKARAAI